MLSDNENKIELSNPIWNIVILSVLFTENQSTLSTAQIQTSFILDKIPAIRFNTSKDNRFYRATIKTTEKPFIEIQYYVDITNPQPEFIFDKILSTFKFTQ
ncbi:hypothetical protein HY404_02890 [Candidatus Microgenomates bacterium]|nr:hypothetical protein [Candidatus Microgenomates bacterium]